MAEIVTAALQEDADGIAVSSYQGGHVEYLKYMVDMLAQRGGENIRIFAGGGGVITADEVKELEAYGVTRIYTPEDGRKMGLVGMIEDTIAQCRASFVRASSPRTSAPRTSALIREVMNGDQRALARLLSALEKDRCDESLRTLLHPLNLGYTSTEGGIVDKDGGLSDSGFFDDEPEPPKNARPPSGGGWRGGRVTPPSRWSALPAPAGPASPR